MSLPVIIRAKWHRLKKMCTVYGYIPPVIYWGSGIAYRLVPVVDNGSGLCTVLHVAKTFTLYFKSKGWTDSKQQAPPWLLMRQARSRRRTFRRQSRRRSSRSGHTGSRSSRRHQLYPQTLHTLLESNKWRHQLLRRTKSYACTKVNACTTSCEYWWFSLKHDRW